MPEAAVREALATARLPTAQPLPPFAGGAGAGAGAGVGAGAGEGAGAGTTVALRGILHCRNPPPGCGPDVASNGHSQSPLAAAAAIDAGASDKKKSRRRSSKSEGGESTLVGYEM